MHFARSEEQQELAEIVRGLLAKRSDSAAVRSAMESEEGYDVSLWQAMCEQVGVAALPVPEELDGFGASLVETATVLEELGHNLAPSPLLATAIASAALLAAPAGEVRDAVLGRVSGGEIATVALDDLTLDGADAAIRLRLDGSHLHLLEEAEVERTETLDQTLRLARIVGGTPTDLGEVDADAVRAMAEALTTAVQVGTAQRGLNMTVAYAKEREQFGRLIGSFQALKHRMADLLVLVEASRSVSWGATAAAAAYLADPGEKTRATLLRRTAAARSYCSDALDQVASETVQLHGGIAITWEHDAHLVFKRAHALSHLWRPAHQARATLL